MKQLSSTLVLALLLSASPAMATPLPPEFIGKHKGGMGQRGQSTKDGALCFEELAGLGGVQIEADGDLVVPFSVAENEELRRLTFKFHNYNHPYCWHPLEDGEDRYSAALIRYGAVFRILVKLHRKDGSVAAIQWICAEPDKAEQGGADQPATAPESKSEGNSKPQPESEGRSQ